MENVEENMGAIVCIKLSMNCGETNMDITMNAKKEHKLGCKKEANLDEKRDGNYMEKTWVQ